jgi:hypothetical protein
MTPPLLKDCTVTGTAEPPPNIGFLDQPPNTIIAGPATGSANGPVTARKLVAADIPPIAGSGDLLASANLSDVQSTSTALANLGGAPLASPALTGTPTAPTAAVDTNTTQVATTAGVLAQAASANPVMNGAVAVGTSTRYARADHVHATDTSCAPLASPALTGTPSAPTAAVDTNTTQLATTAMVLAQAASATPVMDGAATVGTSTRYARADHVHASDTSRAPTASPTLTGTVTIPTPTAGDNSTKAASTAFVAAGFALAPTAHANVTGSSSGAQNLAASVGAGMYFLSCYMAFKGTVNITVTLGWTDEFGNVMSNSNTSSSSGSNTWSATYTPIYAKAATAVTYNVVVNSGTGTNVSCRFSLQPL